MAYGEMVTTKPSAPGPNVSVQNFTQRKHAHILSAATKSSDRTSFVCLTPPFAQVLRERGCTLR